MKPIPFRLATLAILVFFSSLLARPPKDDAPPKKGEAPKGDPSLLTLDRIFEGEFESKGAGDIKWKSKGSSYTLMESSPEGMQLVSHDAATGKKEVVVPPHWFIPAKEGKALSVESYDFSADESKLLIYTNSKRVWRANSRGDYWLLDLSTRELRKLGDPKLPPSSMMFATLSPDGKKAAYVHNNDIYVQDLLDFQVKQLTGDGSPTMINGTFDWVYEEELGLRNGFRWSPDSKHIAYWQIDTEGVKEFYITDSSDGPYAKLISIPYPKTGEQNSSCRVGVVPVTGGKTVWLDVPGDPREHYIAKMEWSNDEVVLQQFNRLQNQSRVMLGNPATGQTRTVLTEKDAAWVENVNDIEWLDGGKRFVWLSERDGWTHAYLVSRDGKTVTPITSRAFDVIHVDLVDEKGGFFYYTASPDNPTQRYLFRVPLQGGTPERLTPADQPGTHSYSLSPTGEWAVHRYSTFTRPTETELIHLPDHKTVKPLGDTAELRKKLDALKKCPTELFRVKIEGGVELDGWCIKPPDFDEKKKYPVLFHVYGEPAGQTVVDRWGGRQFLWHSMLAQQGYLVMSIDNRGTAAPRGRDWRRSIYRQVGILASADQAATVKALQKERPYMDPNRTAIWGWSGGGSMSLNAIFRYPEVYQTAMAVAPVPNQRHYDTIYQERYMGLPSDNVEGYRKGSPIHFAHQLKGNLLLMHGTGDDNCHYHGVESLIDELIAHNKPFSMMAYPNRSHSISEGKGTTRHVYETLTRYLKTNCPPG
jgi:dipeptidyl-peptidase 4